MLKKPLKKISLFFIVSAFSLSYAQNGLDIEEESFIDSNENAGRAISLRGVIEEVLRENPFEQIRHKQNSIIDISRKNLRDQFWLPQISFDIEASNQRFDRVYTSSSSAPSDGSQVSPNGRFGIAIEDYTLFNWGRDYLAYLNDKHIIDRSQQRLSEARRNLRFQAISQYFNLIRFKAISTHQREQLRQYSFIHRLSREKLQLKKISSQVYYQTRSEYLRSQTEYQQSLFEVGTQEESMANILNDQFKPSYRPTEQLKFRSLNTSASEAVKYTLKQSPALRDAMLAYKNTSRSYEKALKDNMPLPKLSLNLGTYYQSFAPQGNAWERETLSGSRHVDLVASLDMSWNILGSGGFLNQRDREQAYLQKKIAEIDYYNTKRSLEVRVRTLFKNIKYLEQKVTIANYQLKTARSNYDKTLDNFVAGKTDYPNIKLSLDNYISSSINYENVKYDHLLKKLELASLMNIDDLPGRNFETLAVK